MQAELPEVIEQLVMWYGVRSAVYMLFAVLLVVMWVVLETKLNKLLRDEDGDIEDEELYYMGYLMFGSIGRLTLLIFITVLFNLEWLQIWIAPKIWLMEYTAKLVN